MKKNFKDILVISGQVIGSILVLFIFFVMPIYSFISCNNQKHEEYVKYIKEANANPQYYAITYTDGYSLTKGYRGGWINRSKIVDHPDYTQMSLGPNDNEKLPVFGKDFFNYK